MTILNMKVTLKNEDKVKIANGDDLHAIMQKVLSRDSKLDKIKEKFYVAGLAVNSTLIFIELVSMGLHNRTIIDPRSVFQVAVLKGAVSVILIHTHPGGGFTPSKDDKAVTDRFIVAGAILGIPVLDHLIVNETEFASFAAMGLMDDLQKNSQLKPSYLVEEKRNIEIALEMKKRGIADKLISECTGLSVKEIKKIDVTNE